MPIDEYKSRTSSVSGPIRRGVAITPSDTVDLVEITRALSIGVDGDITVIMADDTVAVLLKNRSSGDYPYMVKRVMTTGTTATNIVGLY